MYTHVSHIMHVLTPEPPMPVPVKRSMDIEAVWERYERKKKYREQSGLVVNEDEEDERIWGLAAGPAHPRPSPFLYSPPALTFFAVPMTVELTLLAKRKLHRLSPRCSAMGERASSMSVLLFPPSEFLSSQVRVEFL